MCLLERHEDLGATEIHYCKQSGPVKSRQGPGVHCELDTWVCADFQDKRAIFLYKLFLKGYCTSGTYFWTLCVYSQKNKATLDKVSIGSD